MSEQDCLIRALRRIAQGRQLSSLDVPLIEDAATALAEKDATLAYWQRCADCGADMSAPGHCSKANEEALEGWLSEIESERARTKAAEAQRDTLRAALVELLDELNGVGAQFLSMALPEKKQAARAALAQTAPAPAITDPLTALANGLAASGTRIEFVQEQNKGIHENQEEDDAPVTGV